MSRKHSYRPPRQFFDMNDYQTYAEMSLGELIQEERNALTQIRATNNPDTLRYLRNDLDTIRRVLKDYYGDRLLQKIDR